MIKNLTLSVLFILVSSAYAQNQDDRYVSPGGFGEAIEEEDAANNGRGTDIMGPPTMNHPTYPTSPSPAQQRQQPAAGAIDDIPHSAIDQDQDRRVPATRPQPRGEVED